jgi:acid phosphatase family membrane protein YuiD
MVYHHCIVVSSPSSVTVDCGFESPQFAVALFIALLSFHGLIGIVDGLLEDKKAQLKRP